jgi:transposase InsO family protein
MNQEILLREIVLQEVYQIRSNLPGVGTRKLQYLLQGVLQEHGLHVGRDYLFELLAEKGLLIRRRRRRAITTNSNHWMRKYDNLIGLIEIHRPEQVWVSDITYLRCNNSFVYLSLITDAYSHQIMGYRIQNDLSVLGCLQALQMAIRKRSTPSSALIHHSDRGSQYCSKSYVELLTENNIEISMTQNGDPYENSVAERLNGILKGEFKLYSNSGSLAQLQGRMDEIILAYNTLRPHDSCDRLTPQQAHQKTGKLKKRWKNYKRRKMGP